MADSTITGLTADTSPTTDDLVVTVNDPAGTPANRKVAISDLLKLVYPIGSYYINETDSTNPATLFGFGTWTAVQDTFIVGHGSTYTSTGGSASHSHPLSDNGQAQVFISGGVIALRRITAGSYSPTHQVTGTGGTPTGSDTVGTGLQGNTDSTTNVPPYQAAYIWKRTA